MIPTLVLLRQLRPWITKVEFKYIERNVKIEKPVATTQGKFFFVKNPNYVVATNSQWRSNNPKGAKVALVIMILNTMYG